MRPRPWTEAAWPNHLAAEAVVALGRRSRLRLAMSAGAVEHGGTPRGTTDVPATIQNSAGAVGLEAEPVEVAYIGVERFLKTAAPLVVALPERDDRILCVLGYRRGKLRVLTPDLREIRVALDEVGDLLRAPLAAPVQQECSRAAAECGADQARTTQVCRALLDQLLAGATVGGCWILRPGPQLRGWRRLKQAGAVKQMAMFLACHVMFVLVWLGSWWILGEAVLQDRISVAALVPWALLLATLIPLRLLRNALSGSFAIDVGVVLKQSLLTGAQNLKPARMRHLGVGQLLGSALEAEAMETLTLASGLVSLMAVMELIFAGGVLAHGVGGLTHLMLLVASVGALIAVALQHHRRVRIWAKARLDLTHEAVEALVGHRTRLIQQPPSAWHGRIDQLQTQYVSSCEALDRLAMTLHAVVPRTWLLVGLLPVIPPFISGSASAGALATALGGVLIAFRAFWELGTGLQLTSIAVGSWERLRPLVESEDEDHNSKGNVFPARPPTRSNQIPVLEGAGLTYRHASREEAAVSSANVKIRPGDRILLEGASGSGKSTLGSILSGNSVPASGVLLLGGLDLRTLGTDQWRRRVVLVPQFHDNRLFMGSFAFNLLMGREWPASAEALQEAEQVCKALGLGELLDRMPGRLSQPVGETGWRLSHGEQTRVFIARAVLQKPELMILDESLAALDTANLTRVLGFLREQPSALLVIAHP